MLEKINLSVLDRRMLGYLTEGLENSEIAKRESKSTRAVGMYLARIYERIGARNRTEAAVWYVRHGG